MNKLKIFFILFILTLALIPMFLVTSEYKDIVKTKKWTLEQGSILSSSVYKMVGAKSRIFYCPAIIVTYIFNNDSFTSKLQTKGRCGTYEESMDDIQNYHAGESVNIYVNPSIPAQIRSSDYPSKHITWQLLIWMFACFGGVISVYLAPEDEEKTITQADVDAWWGKTPSIKEKEEPGRKQL